MYLDSPLQRDLVALINVSRSFEKETTCSCEIHSAKILGENVSTLLFGSNVHHMSFEISGWRPEMRFHLEMHKNASRDDNPRKSGMSISRFIPGIQAPRWSSQNKPRDFARDDHLEMGGSNTSRDYYCKISGRRPEMQSQMLCTWSWELEIASRDW